MSAVPNNASESEDDSDFVPPAGGDESESDGDEPALKRARTGSPKATAEEEGVKKQTREALWSTFQASVDEPHSKPVEKPKRMVKIEKRYLFAGEYTVEVVEVPEDSPDAKKWPLWRPPDDPAASSPAPGTQDSPSLSPGASTSSTRPAAKKPGPRKPRTSLADIPSQKARKLSTLDKSSMDWRAHVNSESPDIKDELDANRRGGGYLEKVEFLNRVDARKGDALELSKIYDPPYVFIALKNAGIVLIPTTSALWHSSLNRNLSELGRPQSDVLDFAVRLPASIHAI